LPEIANGLRDGRFIAGPLGAFLVARLTGSKTPSCDPSLAQRTLAWDLASGTWTGELAVITGTEPSWWPAGRTVLRQSRNAQARQRARVPLRAVLGDVGRRRARHARRCR
jgi:glycerol kinase